MEENGVATTTSTVAGAEEGGSDNIKIKVSYCSKDFDVLVSPQSTFGDLKNVIAKTTGLDPEVQNLLFRGKEKDDQEGLAMAGLKDNAKVIVTEKPLGKEEDLEKDEEIKEKVEEISRGVEAVGLVRKENDEFAEQVVCLEAVVTSGTQVADKDFIFLTEMLMRQLLKLDGIDARGEGRTQRKLEVRRVQGLVDKLDHLKTVNSKLSVDTSETATSEPSAQSSKVTQEWEVFES